MILPAVYLRIAELFEARMPKDPAILADIDGEVVFGGIASWIKKNYRVVNGDAII